MNDQTGNVIFYALLLILPVSALFARRLPLGRTAVMALAWVGIFATGLVIVGLVHRNQWLVSGTRELFYGQDQSVVGNEVRVPVSDDGHYYVRASINGVERRLMVDSGASYIMLSSDTAAAAKLATDDLSPGMMIETANGVVSAKSAKIATLTIGGITATDMTAAVAPEFGKIDVVGMNFLSKLKSWRVEGNVLILVPASK